MNEDNFTNKDNQSSEVSVNSILGNKINEKKDGYASLLNKICKSYNFELYMKADKEHKEEFAKEIKEEYGIDLIADKDLSTELENAAGGLMAAEKAKELFDRNKERAGVVGGISSAGISWDNDEIKTNQRVMDKSAWFGNVINRNSTKLAIIDIANTGEIETEDMEYLEKLGYSPSYGPKLLQTAFKQYIDKKELQKENTRQKLEINSKEDIIKSLTDNLGEVTKQNTNLISQNGEQAKTLSTLSDKLITMEEKMGKLSEIMRTAYELVKQKLGLDRDKPKQIENKDARDRS